MRYLSHTIPFKVYYLQPRAVRSRLPAPSNIQIVHIKDVSVLCSDAIILFYFHSGANVHRGGQKIVGIDLGTTNSAAAFMELSIVMGWEN
eukprot:5116925-Pyramimonas_sp.AAC.1